MATETKLTFDEYVDACKAEGRPVLGANLTTRDVIEAGARFLINDVYPLFLQPGKGTPDDMIARRTMNEWDTAVAKFTIQFA
jgi:hypothetical protein